MRLFSLFLILITTASFAQAKQMNCDLSSLNIDKDGYIRTSHDSTMVTAKIDSQTCSTKVTYGAHELWICSFSTNMIGVYDVRVFQSDKNYKYRTDVSKFFFGTPKEDKRDSSLEAISGEISWSSDFLKRLSKIGIELESEHSSGESWILSEAVAKGIEAGVLVQDEVVGGIVEHCVITEAP